MFENLTNRLSCTLRNISNRGRLTEENIKKTLREVRMALLEADVALPVVHKFINHIKINSIGHKINKSLTPGQEFIKIVKNELITSMGTTHIELNLSTQLPAIILVVGLQGVGKTTSIAKLGKLLKEKNNKKVLVVSIDIYRPAAIKQLEILAKNAGIDFFPSKITETPIDIINNALQYSKLKFYDILIIDTAGRLHINKIMMHEIKQIHTIINPIETLFIVDAMTGQDAANTAREFNKILPLTGIILTKVDSDTRGGAALSISYITGKPIKFIGVGEKIDTLEKFYPERIASRILGMGDILSLIDDIEKKVDHTLAKKLTNKLKKGNDFNLNDFLDQLKQMRNMGGISNVLKKLPTANLIQNKIKLPINDKILIHMEAIINSMTLKERIKPEIIKGSRKRRIAMGSGLKVQDVNRLLKQFYEMQRIIKKIKKGGISKIINNIQNIIQPNSSNYQ
ncbi:Signal recognition particle protein [Serratia symbiotica]|nr:Signal recognition particle protein [Serratia symbiotica]